MTEPSLDLFRDSSGNQFICKAHKKPIVYINLKEENSKFRLFCSDCMRELERMRSTTNEALSSFITKDKYNYFDEPMSQFKEFQQQKIKGLKAFISSIESEFDELIESLNSKKHQLKELLRVEMEHQNEILSQLCVSHKKYQLCFQSLLLGGADEELLKTCADLYTEIDAKTSNRFSAKNDSPESKRVLQLYYGVQTLLAKTVKSLNELFPQQTSQISQTSFDTIIPKKLVFYPPVTLPNDQSPSPQRAITSRRSNNREMLLPQRNPTSPSPRKSNEFNNTRLRFPQRTLMVTKSNSRYTSKGMGDGVMNSARSNSKEVTPRPRSRNSEEFQFRRTITPAPQTNTIVSTRESPVNNQLVFDEEVLKSERKVLNTPINSHVLETKMKTIDTMTYIVEKQLLVYAGPLVGDQHSSLVFYKMDSEPKILKVCSAHSQTVTALVCLSRKLFSCSKDCQVKLWDTDNFVPLLILKHLSCVIGITLYEKKNLAFTYGQFPDIRVWNLSDLTDWYIKLKTDNYVSQLHFIEKREWLVATNGQTGTIYIMDYNNGGEMLYELAGQSSGYDAMEFDAERDRLLTIASDGILKIWNFETADPYVEKTIPFKYKGGYYSTNSLIVDFKTDMVYVTNSRNNFWIGNIAEGTMVGFLNWIDVGVKNIHKIVHIKRRQWILAANKNNGKIAIINLKELLRATTLTQKTE